MQSKADSDTDSQTQMSQIPSCLRPSGGQKAGIKIQMCPLMVNSSTKSSGEEAETYYNFKPPDKTTLNM